MLYFAYGSNMDTAQMERRCPGSRWLGPARLDGYTFRFDGKTINWGKSSANLVLQPGSQVWGVVYEVTDEHLAMLDNWEWVPVNYHRELVPVHSPELGELESQVYIREQRDAGAPAADYLNAILKGATENHLPVGYLATVVDASGF